MTEPRDYIAADTHEATVAELQKENARLREALEKIAFVGSGYTNTAQRAIARAALSKEKE